VYLRREREREKERENGCICMGIAYGNPPEEYVFSKTINNPCNKST